MALPGALDVLVDLRGCHGGFGGETVLVVVPEGLRRRTEVDDGAVPFDLGRARGTDLPQQFLWRPRPVGHSVEHSAIARRDRRDPARSDELLDLPLDM